MDHRSSCRSAEIAPNQSELRWAIAELVAMHEDGDEDQVDDNDDGDDYQVMILLITWMFCRGGSALGWENS